MIPEDENREPMPSEIALHTIARALGDIRDMMREARAREARLEQEATERENWRGAKLEAYPQGAPCLYCESATGLWIKRGTTIVGCTVCVGGLLASVRGACECASLGAPKGLHVGTCPEWTEPKVDGEP